MKSVTGRELSAREVKTLPHLSHISRRVNTKAAGVGAGSMRFGLGHPATEALKKSLCLTAVATILGAKRLTKSGGIDGQVSTTGTP